MQNPNKRVLIACAFALFFFTACKKSLSVDQKSEVDYVVETALPVHSPVKAYVNDNCAGITDKPILDFHSQSWNKIMPKTRILNVKTGWHAVRH